MRRAIGNLTGLSRSLASVVGRSESQQKVGSATAFSLRGDETNSCLVSVSGASFEIFVSQNQMSDITSAKSLNMMTADVYRQKKKEVRAVMTAPWLHASYQTEVEGKEGLLSH